jgi:hypothetical protein
MDVFLMSLKSLIASAELSVSEVSRSNFKSEKITLNEHWRCRLSASLTLSALSTWQSDGKDSRINRASSSFGEIIRLHLQKKCSHNPSKTDGTSFAHLVLNPKKCLPIRKKYHNGGMNESYTQTVVADFAGLIAST